MLIQFEPSHPQPQVFESLVRRFCQIVLCKGPHTGLGASDDALKTSKSSHPLLPVHGDVAEVEVTTDPHLLRFGMFCCRFFFDFHFSFQRFVVSVETSESGAHAGWP